MDEAFGFDTTTEGRWLGVELDLDGLLRMDKASQVTTLVEAIRGGLYTPNGARQKIDEKPVRGGDTIWMQQQDVPIEVAFDNATNPPEPPPALPAPDQPKQLTSGADNTAAAEQDRSASLGFLVRDVMERSFQRIAETVESQRADMSALRTEIERIETRAALPAPEPLPVLVEPEPEPDDAVEMWSGWFARDALALVREAQAAQSQVVDDAERQRFADFAASTRSTLDTLTAAVQTLATRETVVHVEAPQVHIAPTEVHVEQPDIHVAVTVPPGKVVSRTSKVLRDDVGSITGTETREVIE